MENGCDHAGVSLQKAKMDDSMCHQTEEHILTAQCSKTGGRISGTAACRYDPRILVCQLWTGYI